MDLFFLSYTTVAIAEIGDRSLLVAMLLGARYQRFVPVFLGMAAGLFANQLLSAFVGVWLFSVLPAHWHGPLVAIAFIAMAVWVLIPEGDDHGTGGRSAHSIFLATAIAFFVLEMADKTQLAVVVLAGSSGSLVAVVLGATLGILTVTTPALFLGQRFARRLPLRALRIAAAVLFVAIGAWILLTGQTFG